MDTTKLKNLSQTDLQALYATAAEELKRRSMIDAPDPFAIIKGQEAAKRVLTVAAAGNHSVLLYGPSGVGKAALAAAGAKVGVTVLHMTTCPCGQFDNPSRACRCEARQIKKWWQRKSVQAMLAATDMVFQVSPTPAREILSKYVGTTLKDVQTRLSSKGKMPPDTLDETSMILLKSAVQELGLGVEDVEKIKRLAVTIAALDASETVQCHHLSEAVTYSPYRIMRSYC